MRCALVFSRRVVILPSRHLPVAEWSAARTWLHRSRDQGRARPNRRRLLAEACRGRQAPNLRAGSSVIRFTTAAKRAAARAGGDLIFHAYHFDDKCIDVEVGQRGPPNAHTPAQHRRFHPAARASGDKGAYRRHPGGTRDCFANPRNAHRAGVPMLTDTDSGFAVTPYGKWHALKPKFSLSVSASRRPRPCKPRPRSRWRMDARLAAE
jgi:hypothetical protein